MKNNWITKFVITVFLISSFPNISFTTANAGWFDKKIKVTKCYRPNIKKSNGEYWYKSYKEMKTPCDGFGDSNCSPFEEVDIQAEIDLKDKLIVIESVFSGKISITRHPILTATDSYISTEPNTGYGEWIFDLKKETMSGKKGLLTGIRCMGDCIYKCNFK